ncbi:MAG: hypothetical protein WBV72_04810, partial [Nitrososphaeraceae archaeon]
THTLPWLGKHTKPLPDSKISVNGKASVINYLGPVKHTDSAKKSVCIYHWAMEYGIQSPKLSPIAGPEQTSFASVSSIQDTIYYKTAAQWVWMMLNPAILLK